MRVPAEAETAGTRISARTAAETSDRPPRFLDEQNKDFHLAGDSPCINAGTAAGAPDHDLDGDPRPLYSRSDVGADEFKGAFSDQDADGLTDFWEYYYFGNLAQGPDGNPDADEYSNMEELQNDTHPNHSEDYIFVDRQNGSSGASGASKLEAKYSIQEGIDAAVDGQTVMVLSGVYAGDCDIDFAGKKIVLRSETNNPGDVIIDCQNSARGFHFHNGETQESVLEAITVKNGAADFGAGAYIENASPTINNCVFATNNATDEGGAAYIDTASPVISGCEFTENTAVNKGGRIGHAQRIAERFRKRFFRKYGPKRGRRRQPFGFPFHLFRLRVFRQYRFESGRRSLQP